MTSKIGKTVTGEVQYGFNLNNSFTCEFLLEPKDLTNVYLNTVANLGVLVWDVCCNKIFILIFLLSQLVTLDSERRSP